MVVVVVVADLRVVDAAVVVVVVDIGWVEGGGLGVEWYTKTFSY